MIIQANMTDSEIVELTKNLTKLHSAALHCFCLIICERHQNACETCCWLLYFNILLQQLSMTYCLLQSILIDHETGSIMEQILTRNR
jgi:hypothetical protein